MSNNNTSSPTSLVQFKVGNYRSIREPVTLSMIAGKSRMNKFYSSTIDGHLLKTAVIFGANASGKSNLLRSLFSLRRHLLTADSFFDPQGEILQPFMFDATSRIKPSTFEIHLIHKEHLFIYQVAVSTSERRILSERLRVRWPKDTTMSKVFDRTGDDLEINSNLPLGKHQISRSNRKIIESETLFVASLNKLAKPTIAHLFCEGMYRLEIETQDEPRRIMRYLVDALYQEQSDESEKATIKETALNYLARADMSISDLSVEKNKQGELILYVHHLFKDKSGITHESSLPFEEESDGTQHFLGLLLPIADSAANGSPFIVDELGTNLHPTLLRFILTLFNRASTNAQLILTSHDATLMDERGALSRDQIYFVEKQEDQSTDIYSLADFSQIRNDTKNLSKRYLSGEFGANPIITTD